MRALGAVVASGCFIVAGVMVAAGNMLHNGDFEDPREGAGQLPTAWEHYSTQRQRGGLIEGNGRNDSQCAMMKVHRAPKSGQGLLQIIHVIPGRRYDFEAYVRNDSGQPLRGNVVGHLVIEWLNEAGREVARVSSEEWGPSLSRVGWRKVIIRRAKAPERAAQAKFGIHLFEGTGPAEGAFLVDDVTVIER